MSRKQLKATKTEEKVYDLTDQGEAIFFIHEEMKKAISKVCEANGITIEDLDKEVKCYTGNELYIHGFASEYGITATQPQSKWRTKYLTSAKT